MNSFLSKPHLEYTILGETNITECQQSYILDESSPEDLVALSQQSNGDSQESLSDIISSQKAEEERIKQELEDLNYAKKLEKEFQKADRLVDRKRGSEGEYFLRKHKKSSKNKGVKRLNPSGSARQTRKMKKLCS